MPSEGGHGGAARTADEVMESAHHEAAHAVFALHDGIEVEEVFVDGYRGQCTIRRADVYAQYPWEYALFTLAGAHAACVYETLQHPEPEDAPVSSLLEEEERLPRGDAGTAVDMLRRVVSAEDNDFDGLEDAYAAALVELEMLIEDRWSEIEAVAFVVIKKWRESADGAGWLEGDEVAEIVGSARVEGEE